MTRNLTPTERLDAISMDAMCIGCGLCEALAGPDVVKMTVGQAEAYRPKVVGPLSHEVVDQIYTACPSKTLAGLPTDELNASTQHDEIWGAYQLMVEAYASNPSVRFKASTGGVLTAIGQYLAESRVRGAD